MKYDRMPKKRYPRDYDEFDDDYDEFDDEDD